MVAPSADLQLALDVIGVFVFALSGALVGVRRGLDMVGVVVLAGVAGLAVFSVGPSCCAGSCMPCPP
ncbi:MAG: TRIC cation channel family protein [Ornithinimicrobium sp.]|jgi:uncharacterized membrane protein YeiH|uniref:TRIC cation channel family protein n=1 Tax=Ornithinimicrobium sp. TaxID=1977084 RepID=UPI003D9AC965